MNSVTGGKPKELLPLGSKSVLERIMDEARTADVDGVSVINSHFKPEIDDAIDEWSHGPFSDLPLRVDFQVEPRGLGHAIACAHTESEALVLLGDNVYHGGSPVHRMASLVFRGIDGCIAVEHVDESLVHLYGIVEIDEFNGNILRVLEKPDPSQTKSRWAVAGRFAFGKPFMGLLAEYCEDPVRLIRPEEIGLTEIIEVAIGQGMDFKAVALQAGQKRVDCGSAAEYAQARRLDWD